MLFVLLLPVLVLSQEFDYKKAATDIVSERFSNFKVSIDETPIPTYIDNFKREYRKSHVMQISVCTNLSAEEVNHNTLDNINWVSNDIYQYFFNKFADEQPPQFINDKNYYFNLQILIMVSFSNNCDSDVNNKKYPRQFLYMTSEDNIHYNRGSKIINYEDEIFTKQ